MNTELHILYSNNTDVRKFKSTMTKGGTRLKLSSILAIIIVLISSYCICIINAEDFNENGLDCWDVCVFEQADDPKATFALSILYEIINRIRHMRIFDGVNFTFFLLLLSSILIKYLPTYFLS